MIIINIKGIVINKHTNKYESTDNMREIPVNNKKQVTGRNTSKTEKKEQLRAVTISVRSIVKVEVKPRGARVQQLASTSKVLRDQRVVLG